MPHGSELSAVAIGSGIGFGIGLSVGIILYYVLVAVPRRWTLIIGTGLLALFAGNMALQSAAQLTLADWISSTPALWNTARMIPEPSVVGQLLHGMFGYEATPSAAQVASYLAALALVAIAAYIGARHRPKNPN